MAFELDKDKALSTLSLMLRIRLFEEKIEEMFSYHVMHGTTHLAIGQEAVHAGVSPALDPMEWIVTTHRCHGHTLAKGSSIEEMFAEFLGYSNGLAYGLGGSMHLIDVDRHNAGSSAVVGSGVPIATGMALQLKRSGSKQLAVAFFGDGASSRGAIHESMNIASVMRLPVLFLCEHNMYGMSACARDMVSTDSIAHRGASYGIESRMVDGNDVEAVFESVTHAADYIREHGKPYLLETRTYRFSGLSKNDKKLYRTHEEEQQWLQRDPIALFEQRLIERKQMSVIQMESLRQSIKDEMDTTVEQLMNNPQELTIEEAAGFTYASKEDSAR